MRQVSLLPDDGRRETEADVLRSLVDGLIAEDLFGFRSRGRIGSVAGALYLPLDGDERHVQVRLRSDAVVFRARPAVALQPYRLSRPPVLLLGADGDGPVPLTPRELLEVARRLEATAGRERGERWGPRTLDVDVLLVDDLTVEEPDLVVPHPRMWERRFVVAPLAELAPELVPEGWEARLAGDVTPAGRI